MVLEIRFHGVFGPQLMIDFEVGSNGASSFIMAVSKGFMFAVKRRWLSIVVMEISSCGTDLGRVTLQAAM